MRCQLNQAIRCTEYCFCVRFVVFLAEIHSISRSRVGECIRINNSSSTLQPPLLYTAVYTAVYTAAIYPAVYPEVYCCASLCRRAVRVASCCRDVSYNTYTGKRSNSYIFGFLAGVIRSKAFLRISLPRCIYDIILYEYNIHSIKYMYNYEYSYEYIHTTL